MMENSQENLIRRCQAGQTEAFGELVQRHHRAIVHYVHRFLGISDRATAEDIAQDVFLAAWKAAPAFTPRAAALTWLLRITINICLNHSRSRRRKPTVPLIGEPVSADKSRRTPNPDTTD